MLAVIFIIVIARINHVPILQKVVLRAMCFEAFLPQLTRVNCFCTQSASSNILIKYAKKRLHKREESANKEVTPTSKVMYPAAPVDVDPAAALFKHVTHSSAS